MVEQGASKLRDRLGVQRPPEIDTIDLGSKGAGNGVKVNFVGRTQWASRYQPCEGTVRDAGLCKKRSCIAGEGP